MECIKIYHYIKFSNIIIYGHKKQKYPKNMATSHLFSCYKNMLFHTWSRLAWVRSEKREDNLLLSLMAQPCLVLALLLVSFLDARGLFTLWSLLSSVLLSCSLSLHPYLVPNICLSPFPSGVCKQDR